MKKDAYSDYTFGMFFKDQEAMYNILGYTRILTKVLNVEEDEFTDTTMDMLAYFKGKYREYASDYGYRYIHIQLFLVGNETKLRHDNLIWGGTGKEQMSGVLVNVLLKSYNPPIVPSIFPQSTLREAGGLFDYTKVIAKVKQAKS